jgi:hypothetical protein
MGTREPLEAQPVARDLDARHQAAELADALRTVVRYAQQLDANGVLAVRKAEEALARYRSDGSDLTIELQCAAALMLYRLNEVPRQFLYAAVVEAARNLKDKLSKLESL